MAIWEKIADPAKRMERARRKLFENRNCQFWGVLGLTMSLEDAKLIARPDIDTMATDGIDIFYNPDYVMTLTQDECIFVIAHEISHPALDHFRRQGDRDGHTWNMAGDYELNADLIKAGLTMPAGGLFDPRFDGLSAEQIFSVIERENKEDERNGNTPRHQAGSGDMLEPIDRDTGLPMSGDAKADLADQWQANVSQALGAARKAGTFGEAGGHVPSHLESVTATIRAPNIIDWRQPLRAFIDNLGSVENTWSKLSRRGLSYGMALQGEEIVRPSLIAVIVDRSGSMDETKCNQAIIEGQSMLDDMACDAIDVIYTDTRVHAIDHYEAGDTLTLRTGMGGGTNFDAVMAHIRDSTEAYAAVIFITDGQTSSFGAEPDCPVLWAITDTVTNTERLKIPFGERLSLYTS